MIDTDFDPVFSAASLLRVIGRNSPDSVCEMRGGRNNRVWKVVVDGEFFVLKRYRWSPEDPRDRLRQEWQFLTFLQSAGINAAPAPLAKDEVTRTALLEFIHGDPIPPATVTADDIRAAVRFFREINSHREMGAHLGPVSEACFSIREHLETTGRRVERLKNIQADRHPEVVSFVTHFLIPLWERIRNRLSAVTNPHIPLGACERCISPSDFGFHNALRHNAGLRFLDFEYAGWDDPAKTIVDFCNQPDGLLPGHLAELFQQEVADLFSHSCQQRVRLLEPLYQLKWACICLNNFLPGGTFNDPNPDRSPSAQLARAETMAKRAAGGVFCKE